MKKIDETSITSVGVMFNNGDYFEVPKKSLVDIALFGVTFTYALEEGCMQMFQAAEFFDFAIKPDLEAEVTNKFHNKTVDTSAIERIKQCDITCLFCKTAADEVIRVHTPYNEKMKMQQTSIDNDELRIICVGLNNYDTVAAGLAKK